MFVAVYFLIGSALVYRLMPASIEASSAVDKIPTGKVSLWKLIRTWRIFICSVAAGVNVFQFTFIEPFLPLHMQDYGVSEKLVGLIFLTLSVGNMISCLTVHKLYQMIEPLRFITLAFCINGLSTIFYGPSLHLHIPQKLAISCVSLFLGGFSSAYSMIPLIGQMIKEA